MADKDHNQPSLHELSDLISIKEFKEKVSMYVK